MTTNNIELTRRKILAAIGAVGAAGAGAGVGTSAIFNDEESFEGNTLAAGELDLKVDWEEHYSYPQTYGRDDPEALVGAMRSEPTEGDFVEFPPGANSPMLWVPEGEVGNYMDATALEAFPDPTNDGIQDFMWKVNGERVTYDPCIHGADLAADLAPSGTGATRTSNPDTFDETDGPKSLIHLEDVKPGDFGEVTLSTHLCDNDGYLWVTGELVDASENGTPDPESGAEGEGEGVELLDAVQCTFFNDFNGNNLVDCPDKLDLIVAVDVSGSIEGDEPQEVINAGNALADTIKDIHGADALDGSNPDIRVGFVTFGDNSVDFQEHLNGSADPFFDGDVQNNDADLGQLIPNFTGNTPMPAALKAAKEHFFVEGREDAYQRILLVTDGGPNYEPEPTYDVNYNPNQSGDEQVSLSAGDATGEGGGEVNEPELRETATVAQTIRDKGIEILTVGILTDAEAQAGNDQSHLVTNPFYNNLNLFLKHEVAGTPVHYFNTQFGGGPVALARLLAERLTVCDWVAEPKSLRNALNSLGTGTDGITLDGLVTTDGIDPFTASTTYNIGFSWWVPSDVGNEIQSDSVSFNLGFYTQQARNNEVSD